MEKRLATRNIQYAMNAVQMRALYIPENSLQCPANTIFTHACPRRVIIGFVDGDSFNGNIARSSFTFGNHDVSNIYLDFNGRTIPSRPLALDYENDRYAHAYIRMVDGLGLRESEGNGVTMKMFKESFNFYIFDISPTLHTDNIIDYIRQSNLVVRVEFSKPVKAKGLYMIVYSEMPSILTIDKDRKASCDSSV